MQRSVVVVVVFKHSSQYNTFSAFGVTSDLYCDWFVLCTVTETDVRETFIFLFNTDRN